MNMILHRAATILFFGDGWRRQYVEAYAGDKNLIMIEGDHNSPRPSFFFDSTIIFFMSTLHPPGVAEVGPLKGAALWLSTLSLGVDEHSFFDTSTIDTSCLSLR